MNLSIVTGTYNRITHLQCMVVSVRRSFENVYGLSYQIVVVDGGSQDGTQDWCKSQPNLLLIEHGTLKGAVKAFNDGALAATGDYVILANDDIEFIGDSVLRAWVFMQRHPDCGMGCFFQDRNGQDWHVEGMPCIVNGEQKHLPYGQVCIVSKWLGDRLGWWGDYLHTYGGDNELSANIYEAGWKILPMDNCRIHDDSPDDDLRRINNITGAKDPRAVRGAHPDSWAWGRKWRHGNMAGPVVRDRPTIFGDTPIMNRTLYLPIFEQGWAVQKEQKRGLREALARYGVVDEFDYVSLAASMGRSGMMTLLAERASRLRPTTILTQLHGPDPIGPSEIARLRQVVPEARIVNWNGDYWPENLLSPQGLELARAVDLQLTVNRDALEEYRRLSINAGYWQIGWEPDGVSDDPLAVECDVVFLGNGYSRDRQEFVRNLRKLSGITFRLWGQGWPDGWAQGQCLYDFKAACRIYRSARLSLGDSQWPESGFVSNRVMQALAAGGSALCHQWFRGMEDLGLRDGETCVVWRSFPELVDKMIHYLNRDGERQRIAEAGKALALERHSFDRRVEELRGMISTVIPHNGEEDWR